MNTNRFIANLIALAMSVVLGSVAMGQGSTVTELGGSRAAPVPGASVDTNATFAIGLTTDNGFSWRNSATPTESLRIVGRVRPENAHLGQQADIYMVVRTGAVFLMRKSDGSFTQWSGSMSELIPYRQQVSLTSETEVDLYNGKLGVTGQFQLFLAYRPADGVLHYSPKPFALTINTNPQGSPLPWSFNGTDWQSNGTVPACPSPLLQLPLDLNKVTSILYPGQTRGGDYKAHGGFRLDGNGQTNQVNVVSAISGTIFRGERDTIHGVVQHGFDIINPCGVMMRIGHLSELSPKFAAIADTLPPATNNSSVFTELAGYTVNAGDLIATAIGLPGNVFMDFGIYDLRTRNPATTGMSGEIRPYGTCWFDAFSTADSARVRSLPPTEGVANVTSDFCK